MKTIFKIDSKAMLFVASIFSLVLSLATTLAIATVIVKAMEFYGYSLRDQKLGDNIAVGAFVSMWISATTCIWTTRTVDPRFWIKPWLLGSAAGTLASFVLNGNHAPAAFAAFGTAKALIKAQKQDQASLRSTP